MIVSMMESFRSRILSDKTIKWFSMLDLILVISWMSNVW